MESLDGTDVGEDFFRGLGEFLFFKQILIVVGACDAAQTPTEDAEDGEPDQEDAHQLRTDHKENHHGEDRVAQ